MTHQDFKHKISEYIATPITHYPARLFSLAAMIAIFQLLVVMFVGPYTVLQKFLVCPFMLCQGVILSWILMLLYPVNARGNKIYWGVWMALFFTFSLIDIYFLTFYKQMFNILFFGAIVGSNPKESTEFFSTFMVPSLFINIGVMIGLVAAVFFIFKKLKVKAKAAIITLLTFCGVGIGLFAVSPMLCAETSSIPLKSLLLFEKFRNCFPRDLERPEVKVKDVEPNKPRHIVVIIGESEGRNHCGIYGYEKNTTPNMEQLRADSLLWVFRDVDASDTHTIECFKTFMGTCESGEDLDWYKQTTIIDVAQAAGYRVSWLSNQCKEGYFIDSVVTKFAETSDYAKWAENLKNSGGKRYDEVLQPLLDDVLERYNVEGDKNMIFLHLMGSHAAFSQRYPKMFDKFKPGMYERYPEHQRKVRAEYDNSVLYNDQVVSKMMKSFDGTEAIVIYFSDHALDLFDTDPNYFEHAKLDDELSEKVSREIPFVIYTTPEFKEKNPQTMKLIAESIDKPQSTTNLLYLLMQVMGVEFADGRKTPKWGER